MTGRTSLKIGSRVRMTCSGFGDVDDVETHFEPGELGTISAFDWYTGRQGVAITIEMDCGVTNVFDQGDEAPLYPFELVGRTEPLPLRDFTVSLRAMCHLTRVIVVSARHETQARQAALQQAGRVGFSWDESQPEDIQIECVE